MCCFSWYLALQLKKNLQYSIDINTKQSFRYMELIDAKIWISKNASLCRGFFAIMLQKATVVYA